METLTHNSVRSLYLTGLSKMLALDSNERLQMSRC